MWILLTCCLTFAGVVVMRKFFVFGFVLRCGVVFLSGFGGVGLLNFGFPELRVLGIGFWCCWWFAGFGVGVLSGFRFSVLRGPGFRVCGFTFLFWRFV